VTAACKRFTAVAGPATSTDVGSLVIFVTSKPLAGRPSTSGSTGTVRTAVISNSSVSVDGPTCTTSVPYGTDTLLCVKWKSRRPGLAVSRLKRSAVLPSLPTVSEAGVPGYEAIQWFGLFAPAGTPAPILARLHSETVVALKSPEMQKRLAADGTEAVGNTSAEFTAQIKSELDKWSKVARAANTKAQ